MNEGYSLADISAVAGNAGFAGNEFIWLFALLMLMGGGFGWNNRNGDFGQYATAASQQEILFGQHFQNLDNKLDRLGNGIADSTFALNNSIKDEGRATQAQLAQGFADVNATTISQTQKILDVIQQNKIDSLQAQVSELKTQNMFCGIPRINPYGYGVYPYQGCGCGMNGYAN